MSEETELLIAQVTSAYRATDPAGQISAHPAWHDLTEDERRQAFDETERLRTMEAAMDSQGLSNSARRVLERIRGTSR